MSRDRLAPNFAISVGGTDVNVGLTQFIQRVLYESVDGMADMASVVFSNPSHILSERKAFQPGNEMSVWMGYGTQLEHIGRVKIVSMKPTYPESGQPKLTVSGYTRDHEMMDNEPEGSKKVSGRGGRAFKDVKYSDVVIERAADYGFATDVDSTPQPKTNVIQKTGMSDYDLIKGLSNITGFLFWVDGDENGQWTLHFKDPSNPLPDIQDKELSFKYNDGEYSTLLNFSPELLIQGAKTKIEVAVKDTKSGKIMRTTVEETNDDAPDIAATGDLTSEITKEHTTASDIKLYFGGFSFSAISTRRLKTEADIKTWTEQWFKRQRENFVMGRGKIVGEESLRARQIHVLKGLGKAFEGQYYFDKVKHVMSGENGYTVDFHARRVVPEL